MHTSVKCAVNGNGKINWPFINKCLRRALLYVADKNDHFFGTKKNWWPMCGVNFCARGHTRKHFWNARTNLCFPHNGNFYYCGRGLGHDKISIGHNRLRNCNAERPSLIRENNKLCTRIILTREIFNDENFVVHPIL